MNILVCGLALGFLAWVYFCQQEASIEEAARQDRRIYWEQMTCPDEIPLWMEAKADVND